MKDFRHCLGVVLCVAMYSMIALTATGQPVNDICASAFHLPNTVNYCSQPGQFSNVSASGTGQLNTPCLISLENDIWFTFIPNAPAILIRVTGNVNNMGTLQGPGIFAFEGNCGNLNSIGCNTAPAQQGVIELTLSNLVLGGVYYLAIVGAVPGTFQICLNEYIPPPHPEGDCHKGAILCDKSPFFVEHLSGIGDPVLREVVGSCIGEEFASVWYRWTCDEPGTLTFTLTPNNWVPGTVSDDLDFVVYELPGGIDDCNNKQIVRCMASGANTAGGVVLPLSEWALCNGPTGLREGETDVVEMPGCLGNSNNFLAPLEMEAGKSYALIVNNFSQSGQGFSIEWGGTGTFLGPSPDFEVDAVEAFECDKTIIFTNQSLSPTDSIVNWSWSFGAGATPLFTSGTGPHTVIYESFGAKRAALTIESSRGCLLTKLIDLYVEPCCADTSTLDAGAIAQDQICPGVADGLITGIGFNGAPPYQFSLDGTTFQPSTVFPFLPPGDYEVYIQDIKGCRDSTVISIMEAPPFTVFAGDTVFVDLGFPAQLHAIPFPPFINGVQWSPSGSLTFPSDSLNPVAFAPGTTLYTVSVTNEQGCIATDQVLVLVNIIRPVYVPNVFSPNHDGINDYFYIQGGPAATGIEALRIFDRWGALIYEALDIPLNEPQLGWDGTFRGQPVNPGVFTFYTNIRFLDNETLTYSGTVTVVR